MPIMIKYILKNIAEKKFRTFLIVVSITCSAALFFASSAIAGTMTVMYEDQIRMQTGKADLIIRANEQSPSTFFRISAEEVDGVALSAGEVSMGGIYHLPKANGNRSGIENARLHLRGFDLDELELLNPVQFSQRATGRAFSGNVVILSRLFAEQHEYETGDFIDIEIQGSTRRLLVWGIAQPTGLFRDSPQAETRTAVIPLETAAAFSGNRGAVNTAYIILEPGADITAVRPLLEAQYNRFEVQPPFTLEDIMTMLNVIVMPLFLMTSMVLFISAFIIYSTFKVITVERLPVIGTFRSIGATRRMTDKVLMGESLAYGVLGGVFGIAAGIGVLYAIASILAADPWSGTMEFQMQFGPAHLITAFLLAVGVALTSSWIPIARVSKIPIKDLVLNLVEGSARKKRWKTVAAAFLMIAAYAAPRAAPHAVALPVSILAMFMTIIALVLAVPALTKIFLWAFEGIYGRIFGNIGILAVKNLKDNKNILNNITLLTIGISVLLMINTISYSVGVEVLNAYRDWEYDIRVSIEQADRDVEQSLRAVPGVTGTYAARERWGPVRIADRDYAVQYLQGIDPALYANYVAFRAGGNEAALLEALSEGRNILVANMMRNALQLNTGDLITLEMPAGDKTYRVIGFYDSLMMNGSNAMIDQRYYRSDMEQSFVDAFFVRVGADHDPEAVLAEIRSKFNRRGVFAQTTRAMEEMNTQSNNQFFIILQAFSVLAMLIGIFGVLNNYVISFIERKRSLAILKSIGMSRTQTIRMIMAEAVTGGCIAGFTGVLGSLLILEGVPFVMEAASIPMRIHLVGHFFIAAVIGGMVIAVLASLSPALRNSRLDIVEAIKYE